MRKKMAQRGPTLAVRLRPDQRAIVEAVASRELLKASTWARRVIMTAAQQEALRFEAASSAAAT